MDRLIPRLDLRPGEWPLLRLLLALAFARSLAMVFLEVAAGALFLQATGSDDLAYVFMVSALVLVTISAGVHGLERRGRRGGWLTANRLTRVILLLLGGGIALFYALVLRVDAVWVFVLLMVWQMVHAILIELEVANVSGALMDLRQSKRFAGPLASAGVLAVVLGGILTGPLVLLLGNLVQLLILALVATLGCWLLVARLQALAARDLRNRAMEERATIQDLPPSVLGSIVRGEAPYLRVFLAVSVLAAVSIVLVDFLFYRQLDRTLGDQPETLATLLGFYFAAVGIANLLATFRMVPWFLTTGDLSERLRWLPRPVAVGMALALAGVLLGLTLRALGIAIPPALDFTVLVVVLITGLCQDVLQDAFYDPLFRTLYKPLPLSQQRPARWLREAVVEPLAVGLAGLLLLVLTRGLDALGAPDHATFAVVALLLLLVLYGWYRFSGDLGLAYRALLQKLLSRRWLPGEGRLQVDAATVGRLVENCAARDAESPATVLFALRALEGMEYGGLGRCLLTTLDHPDDKVRRHTLERLQHHAPEEAVGALRVRLVEEKNPELLGMVAQVLCRINGPEVVETVQPLLADQREVVQRGALVGLLRHGGLLGTHEATRSLTFLLRSNDPGDRRRGALALGETGIDQYYRPLEALLEDDDLEVRQAALQAAGQLIHPRLVPVLLEQTHPGLYQAATRALVAHGKHTLPLLADTLEEALHRPQRLRLIGILARISDEAAVELLLQQLRYPDALVRYRVLEALHRRRHRVSGEDLEEVHTQLREEASQMIHSLRALEDLDEGPRTAPLSPLGWPGWRSNHYKVDLAKALLGDLRQARQRLLLLLSLLDSSDGFASAMDKLDTSTGEQHAKALEVIDNAIPSEQRTLVSPLVELTAEQLWQAAIRRNLLAGLRERFRSDTLATTLHALNHRSRLSALASRSTRYSSLWSRICALCVLAHQPGSGIPGELLGPARNSGPKALRETALGLLFRHHPEAAARVLQTLRHDPDPRIATLVTTLSEGSEKIMLMDLEKAIILSSVKLFSQVPQEQLLELAGIAREQEVHAGEVVIKKGDQETTMYVVAEGSLQVDIPGVPPFRRGAVVGEMATLANQPRAATVRAQEDSLLLVLDRAPLFELMAEHMSVVEGVIKMLCERVSQ